jgi:RING finger/CHY zinc finger protein 1
MCERVDNFSESSSECDQDDLPDLMTDTTFDSDEDYTTGETIDTRDVRDSREKEKLQDKKENCGHYVSGCKIIANCCDKEFGCRICHDFEISGHEINRYEIKHIICNACKIRQPVSNSCINTECRVFGNMFASYYCNICHLYSDNPLSEIYHCEKCNICRICGIGNKPSDFFHCDKCGGCINIRHETTHKCVTDALRNDCCICLDNIFLSRETVTILPCGHAIHGECFNSSIKQNKYTCPLCRKIMIKGEALEVMNLQYDNIISLYPYDENIKAHISCNDCDFKGEVPFHPIGVKCEGCGGYNTVKIR